MPHLALRVRSGHNGLTEYASAAREPPRIVGRSELRTYPSMSQEVTGAPRVPFHVRVRHRRASSTRLTQQHAVRRALWFRLPRLRRDSRPVQLPCDLERLPLLHGFLPACSQRNGLISWKTASAAASQLHRWL
jgi:hypothetical protein